MTTNTSSEETSQSQAMETNDPLPFCLLCNVTLNTASSDEEPAEKEQNAEGLVLVNPPGSGTGAEVEEDENAKILHIAQEMEEVHGEDVGTGTAAIEVMGLKVGTGDKKTEGTGDTKSSGSGLGDAEWIQKYQSFLSKTLHLNMDEILEDEDGYSYYRFEGGRKPTSPEEELILFCSKCKTEVEKLYEDNEKVKLATKTFEDTRDSITACIARTFVDRKLRAEELTEEDVDMEEARISTTEILLEKWRPIYTGEAERELKERNLINEIREEILSRSETQPKTEFPEGTGLSAMELSKMQRMMTACYFTPKMSILRKKGKLFFRVGIPRDEKDKAKVYNCPVCDDTFNHQRSLSVHMRRHKVARPSRQINHTCPTCGLSYPDRRALIFHKRTHYIGTINAPGIRYQRVQEYYSCCICSCRFASKAGRNSHIKKHHPNEKLCTCALCLEVFKSEVALKAHFENTHRELTTDDYTPHPTELFTCVECSKQFLRIKSLIEHRRVHAIETLSECYYCGMGFEGMDSLRDHTNVTHMIPNPFMCDGCDDCFPTEEALNEHMKSKAQQRSNNTIVCEVPNGSQFVKKKEQVLSADDDDNASTVTKIHPIALPITVPPPQRVTKPLIVNDVTVRDDGLHERFAPLIMKSLQDKSNQPIIVRRGIQVPDKTTFPYAAAIQIKSDGITTDGEIIEATDGPAEDEGEQQQQYIIYNV